MLILVANLGSTSFKYKLYAMPAERVLAVGAADRIGQGKSAWSVTAEGKQEALGTADLMDHAAAIDLHLHKLVELGVIRSVGDVEAVGFKAVHGGPISGAVRVDAKVIATMEQFADVAPAHNPPYIAAMRAFEKELPGVPQVAAFETAFHQTIPMARQVYAIPWEWTQMGVRRYGFHGASHRYIATRMAQIDPSAGHVISCHLGGSCSITAIDHGKSVANSFGMTAQSGVFHNNRVGDFDTFALLKLTAAGHDLSTIFKRLGKEGGLLGISGVSPDMREVEKAADAGNERARLAVEAFVETCRHYVGAYLAALGGADAVVFTGGIGQFGKAIRAAICARMDYAGIRLDEAKNQAASGKDEARIDTDGSRVRVWVVPTNEELIVARQTAEVLSGRG
ncbi:MAG: acetate/propionate family kinase [Phycisphaeraceae bacterium]|nr:acetate/propionate family kinase [Phycisphaeraceae bacterium]